MNRFGSDNSPSVARTQGAARDVCRMFADPSGYVHFTLALV